MQATQAANIVQTVSTTCPYCGVGCGLQAAVGLNGAVAIAGDPSHPANYGRLCSKGSALPETVGLDGRLLYPEIAGRRVGWNEALDAVADNFRCIINTHGPDAVAFYVSGQLLTEDYYVANKMMKGFIGSANIDTNSRLCMASSVAGHKRAFGSDTVPGCYEDLELAELIVLTGSNTAWCHPVVYQRIARAKEQNKKLKIVVVDPRRTATCDIADLHLALKPGTDVTLFNGLLDFLRREDGADYAFIENHTEGFAAAIKTAKDTAASIPAVAQSCGLDPDDVARFYQMFLRTEKTVTLYSQGVNQSSSGTDKVNSIINCHLLTGRIGKPGMGPFSITGQPNAMGGREVGGLANQLAAHMEFGNEAHVDTVRAFWHAPKLATQPGLKAVDMFSAIGDGKIKAVWIMATNPAVSLPDAGRVREALDRCEFVVVSDCMRDTDTTRYADVLLPAAAWGEKEGTVTNSERRISRQRAFLPSPGEAQPDWWIVTQVARRMGYADQFGYQSAADVFREHARLSGYRNNSTRDFDISALANISDAQYDELTPLQWPVTADTASGTARMFTDRRYFTPNGRARFIATDPRPPANRPDAQYPLILNTGRLRDQWHTMTRTGKSPRLAAHKVESFVEVHPDDAKQHDVKDGALARITSRWGDMLARVVVTEDQQRGCVFVPLHWSDQYARHGTVDALVNPATDPVSGQPESKHTPVAIETWQAAWYGFALSRRRLAFDDAAYGTVAIGKQFWRYELAGDNRPDDFARWVRSHLCAKDEKIEWIDYLDKPAGRYRGARLINGRIESCIFISNSFELPPRTWLAELFVKNELTPQERASLLAGKPAKGMKDAGRIICACFGVGENTIKETIAAEKLRTVEDIGQCLKAGTNCGSCIPELKSLLA